MVKALLALPLVITLLELGRGDDMAFVEVSMYGEMDIKYLDYAVPSKAGVAGFFEATPMFTHDWLSTSMVNTTISAVLKATTVSTSVIASRVARVESVLAPLFLALPKGKGGALTDGTARYALHRYFVRRHGWSLKGLEPSGASVYSKSTSLELSEDVKQVSKYVVPNFLLSAIQRAFSQEGIGLHQLALAVVAVEQIVHTDVEETLFSVYRTLQLPLRGDRRREEVASIVATFLLTYAFGTNLEVSTKRAVEDARGFLNAGHPGWWQLWKPAEEMLQSPTERIVDFYSILEFLERFADTYSQLQNRDCARARERLEAAPHFDRGRLPLSDLGALVDDGHRPFFTEELEDLQQMGAVEKSVNGGTSLLAANYLLSQALCLSTASMYTVCCSTRCEELLEHLELAVGAPAGRPEAVVEALSQAFPELRASAALDAATLQELAADGGGLVQLHGRPLAGWLHDLMPLHCPAPGDTAQVGPKTPDEWMEEPDMDVEKLVSIEMLHDNAMASFTSMGQAPGGRDEHPADRLLEAFPVETWHSPLSDLEPQAAGSGWALHFVRLLCMAGVLYSGFSSLASSASSTGVRIKALRIRPTDAKLTQEVCI